MANFKSYANGAQILWGINGMMMGVKNASPIFIPKQHTVRSYSKQNRIAKKRRNNKQSK